LAVALFLLALQAERLTVGDVQNQFAFEDLL
jgi:hypothetical protein